jgi:hypothetical protein
MAETRDQRLFRRGTLVGASIATIRSYESILRIVLDQEETPELNMMIEEILEGQRRKVSTEYTSASDIIREDEDERGYVRQALDSSEKGYQKTHREACERIAYAKK